jgi:hypothetical protein
MKRLALALLGIGLVLTFVLGNSGPMTLIYPLWIATYLFRDKLEQIFAKFPGATGFIVAGVAYGMIIEVFVIMDNWHIPPEKQVLFDANPVKDLTFGIFYYAFVILSWYALLRKITFSPRALFLITGLYGLVAEESGQVVMRMLQQPFPGIVYAIFVMIVYGMFPMLALMVTEKRFPPERKKNHLGWSILALAILFLQLAIYGNTIFPWLKNILPASSLTPPKNLAQLLSLLHLG